MRNAVARFDQVIGVSDGERALAFANIEKAANYYGVDLSETSWQQSGRFIRSDIAADAVCDESAPRRATL